MAFESMTFTLGNTWQIRDAIKAADGSPLPLAGAQVLLRIGEGGKVEKQGAIVDPAAGLVTFTVAPADQQNAGLAHGVEPFEVRVVLANGERQSTNVGEVTINPSLF